MAEQCYVYAIVPAPAGPPPAMTGLGGPLRTVSWGDLGAVVSIEAGDEAARPTPEHLLRHEEVVEAIRAHGPALPVRFGTVLADGDAVKQALAERYEVLRDDLARLGDKVELSVTALWRRPPAPGASLEPTTPSAERVSSAAAEERTEGQHRGASYLRARFAEHQRASQTRERAERVAGELDRALLLHALESRRVLCPSPRLALRNVYLAAPTHVRAFEEAFDAARKEQQDVQLLLSGPWPPYSFVTPSDRTSRPFERVVARKRDLNQESPESLASGAAPTITEQERRDGRTAESRHAADGPARSE